MPEEESILGHDSISDDENADDPDEEGYAVIPVKNKPKKGDFVIVKFATKKKVKHFIGCILEVQNDDTYDIKYMRKKRQNLFVFPVIEDIAIALEGDIEIILDKPKITRDIYEFTTDLSAYDL